MATSVRCSNRKNTYQRRRRHRWVNKVITANLQLKLEQAVHETISATDEVEKSFEQSFEVTVPPGMLQTVTLTWKKIWQVGYIKLLLDGHHVEVPYRVLEGIDYDQVHQTI